MKKVFAMFSSCLLIIACEKPREYKCICTTTQESLWGSGSTTSQKTYKIYDKKRKAERACEQYEPDGVQIWTKTECSLF